ncbi:hypothetical protein FSP39_008386 [Pinctada imbricata]|uniref:Uncharacterized protein n=1 Tax=Pinctada imbricata TaxID=66713 RepID=A0AA88XVZ7_PINIB|nr:hypothetical protein FSP39_008386 [Pinctada imbricata]
MKHNGHDLIEIKEKYEDDRKKLGEETDEIKVSALRGTRLSIEQNKKNKTDLLQRFNEMRTTATDDAKLAKDLIEQGLQKRLSEINKLESDSCTYLAIQRAVLQDHLDALEDNVRNRESRLQELNPIQFLLSSKEAKTVTSDFSKIPEGVIFPLPRLERNITSSKKVLTEICGDIVHVGTIPKDNDLVQYVPSPPPKYWRDDIVCMKTIDLKDRVKGKGLRYVKHTKKGNIWVSDQTRTYQIKEDGTIVQEVDYTKDAHFEILSIGSDMSGHLVMCSSLNAHGSTPSMVKRPETNTLWKLDTNEDPCCLCLVGDFIAVLLVSGVFETLKLKFCLGNGTSEKDQVKLDKKSQSLVLVKGSLLKGGIYPSSMTFNQSSRNLIISSFHCGMVVGVSLDGKYQFEYAGKHPGLLKKFEPWSVECDHLGHILTVDTQNQKVHLLDSKGQFLTFIASTAQGLQTPYGLGVDSNGYLWVTDYSKKSIKVIKYLI